MNLSTDSLYAGVAGVRISEERFELGHGLVLTRTFAHFMAPFLMAFAPAEKGKPNPGPWSAVSDGIGLDIHVQLHVPASFDQANFFDRLNTVWWITALIRLRGAFRSHVPVIADRSFADIPENWNDARMLPVEVLPRHLAAESALAELSNDDLQWLKEVWLPGGRLMDSSATFNDAFQALDGAGGMPTPAVALLAVWGALEHLFSPAMQELRFRVSANIAAYLESPGTGRLNLHQKIMKLYDARSVVAHGTKLKTPDAWSQTYALANRVLMKMLANGCAPSKDGLEEELFAPRI
ncbi:hypothetical protein NB717_001423 [Xanthomonas sacchari]|uniref:hypothetical protein n=1 Tax=Xanthomonas sacchari TaxID=56458 RepID=UPI00225E28A5|nr:hypothetical protein [Xanthomonas sacchari]MCW0460355.1 hypothetical protein [Xanthomonas sacchari]